MHNRITVIWLALLTVYLSYTTTDMYSTVKSVEDCQAHTLKYMERSTAILRKLKGALLKES